jgi:hypothetical protein
MFKFIKTWWQRFTSSILAIENLKSFKTRYFSFLTATLLSLASAVHGAAIAQSQAAHKDSRPATSVPSPGKAACTPNFLELSNLYHRHDINTGDVLLGDTVYSLGSIGRQFGAGGCSPLWAGGSYDDKALFTGGDYPKAIQEMLMKKGKTAPKI